MSVAWSRGGESALVHVARAHALCQLFVRAHSFPGEWADIRCDLRRGCDAFWMSDVISASLRARAW